jgi:hypothetical protein
MSELSSFSENREKILPNQTLLFAEPIFKNLHTDESKNTKFTVPVGAETLVRQLPFSSFTEESITEFLADEYLSIASSLKEINVPFRIIVAHRKDMNEKETLAILRFFGVRGLALDPSISETCFPRDMLVDFNGVTYVSSRANFNFPDNSGIFSPLGEGGRVLKLGRKVFIPDPCGFVQTRPKYMEDIHNLSDHFQFGFLPFPLATEIDTQSSISKIFQNSHLDRVAAFIKGKDNKDYLLLDSNYTTQSEIPYGQYWTAIKDACKKLEVTPVVIERKPESILYALNLEQFADGTILLTGGDDNLTESVKQIVGDDKVHTTSKPIVFYPLYRNGGIRCMMLHAPQKIIGEPANNTTLTKS